jgi:hypothetical protein
MKKRLLNILAVAVILTLSSPVAVLAREHGAGGGGHSFSSGRSVGAGQRFNGGERQFRGGDFRHDGRGWGGGRDYNRGRYYGGAWGGYYGAPYGGYAYEPGCGYYDNWGYWHPYPGCYAPGY